MDQGGLLLATTLGTLFVLFGLWLVPKWRRMRRERKDGGLTFSIGRARERFMWVNTFGSIAVGAGILAVVQIEIRSYLRERNRDQEMLRFAFHCDRHSLEVRNRGDEKRRIHISDVEVYRSWGWERPDHFRVELDVERAIAGGETAQIPVSLAECAPRSAFDDPPRCELRFQFADELTDAWSGCVLDLAQK
jgi:hypothetical protein